MQIEMKTSTPKTGSRPHRRAEKPQLKVESQPSGAAHGMFESEESPGANKPPTQIAARIDVGFGNQLFIRGEGGGLNWNQGAPLHCADASTWIWFTQNAKDRIIFKLLLNDQVWATGQDMVVEAGQRIETVPQF